MKVIIKKETRVFDGFFKIDQARLQHEKFDGSMTSEMDRLNFNRGHSVAILIYNQTSDTVTLTRQFRYPAFIGDPKHGWILEIVAGMLESKESARDTAVRETLEEAGYQLDKLDCISEFFVSPGGSSEKIFLYLGLVTDADRIANGGGVLSEGENIRVEHLKLSDAIKMIETGEICDAKTIIALQWLEKKMRASD